jgi:hypothetical protein
MMSRARVGWWFGAIILSALAVGYLLFLVPDVEKAVSDSASVEPARRESPSLITPSESDQPKVTTGEETLMLSPELKSADSVQNFSPPRADELELGRAIEPANSRVPATSRDQRLQTRARKQLQKSDPSQGSAELLRRVVQDRARRLSEGQ